MIGFNGGLIGGLANARTTSLGSAKGVWTLPEQRNAKLANLWPVVGAALPALGAAFEGGFFAGTISNDANGVATHALIVAPRQFGASGTGYTASATLQWKTTNTSTSGSNSPFDGYANTAAMEAAGLANHPAANFCRGLTIGGFSDWYLPARYELEIAYHNLKPTTDNNDISDGYGGGIPGPNQYSVPTRTATRTVSVPGQTTAANFQQGGAEPFQANSHWTSTDSASNAFFTGFNSGGTFTNDFGFSRTSSVSVRAFRRVAI